MRLSHESPPEHPHTHNIRDSILKPEFPRGEIGI
jgi:hypothetical protein